MTASTMRTALASLTLLAASGCIREAHSQTRAPAATPAADAAPPATPSPVAAPPPTATSATPATRPAVRNVVLITIDSLRADMPWTGYPRPIAPNLTALAARAVTYTRAYAISSYTSMSIGGLLAGRLPAELRRDGSFFNRYPRDNEFFPERLRAAGVRTVAAHAHHYFRPGFAGFEQGFDVYQMVPGMHVDFTTDVDVSGDRHEALAERLLGDPANTSGRFFAWFHFMDPHDRYLPHSGIRPYGRRLRDLYDAEVTWTDQWVGRLVQFIERQPWGAQTAIVISADHGEAFGEHGMFRHAFELWEPLVRVPLLVLAPGAVPRRIDVARSHLDLAPTILDLFGVAPPADWRGTSLVSELYGGAAPERDVMVHLAPTTLFTRRRALIHGRYKLLAIDDRRFELFDLESDPAEAHSLRTTDRAAFEDMLARFRTAQSAVHEVTPYGASFRNRGQR
jgi:arylsulfatase A-like enzyme